MFYEIEITDADPIIDDFKYSSVIRFTPSDYTDYTEACSSLMYAILFKHSKSVTIKVSVKNIITH